MKKNIIIIYIAALTLVLGGMTGCNFLDKNPDMRASIDTKRKVQLLLVSAYTPASFAPICEFSSDQVVDNDAPDKTGHCNTLQPLDKMYNEIFAWEVIKSDGEQDSPEYIWNGCYSAIATCNQALKAIEELEAQGINMNPEKGEALVSRAYHHFILASVFCQAWKDANKSKQDLGITYMTEPETKVAPEYERGTLYDTYMAIEKDLEEGLKLVDDSYYAVPKYHFNTKAAHAFAARFYLYKREYDKVIEHADAVLTTDDDAVLACLYDAKTGRALSDPEQEQLLWIEPTAKYNLLLNTTMSVQFYTVISSYCRYMHNGSASEFSTLGSGPCWKSQFPGFPLWQYKQEYGCFCAKLWYLFEYTDKVNGYGYVHGVTRAFTTNETLLCRAEAKAFKNDFKGAANDFRMWAQSYNARNNMDTLKNGDVDLSEEKIRAFYKDGANINFVPTLHNTDMSPEFIVTDAQKAFVHCALHFRRIECLHDGLRWLDIKRYGIEITHQRGTEPLRTLVWDDDRRAIQLPQKVLVAGMTANPREKLGDHVSPATTGVAPAIEGNPNKLLLPLLDKGGELSIRNND
ncbi:MAG: RagB/SusD family nutrient uptake outer membrane protein [Paludibacteraceae bacterium]|nr:RagB/SusD family nutrient uptake outer membrane protein [Paludibacteraceae bacterium]MBR6492617.1 RagB/SusD family nutrient uptake outer membrane protein [Paludibacteraceae bacterium]